MSYNVNCEMELLSDSILSIVGDDGDERLWLTDDGDLWLGLEAVHGRLHNRIIK